MRPICSPERRCVRVELDGEARWGVITGDEIVLSDNVRVRESDAVYLAPAAPSKILAVHLTYGSRVREYEARTPPEPSYFMKPPTTLNGHRRPVLMAKGSQFLNYEGELAVVIGRAGRHIPAVDALAHVAGYSCFNDGSVRDWQRHTSQFTPGKNFDRTGSFGPWIVTRDEIPDPRALTLTTRLQGEVMQQASVDLLIFDIPTLLAYLSTFTELQPGDVIATGTPGGVGMARDPQRFMQPGELVEIDIAEIGVLRNTICAEGDT